jgi:hypothetical protein
MAVRTKRGAPAQRREQVGPQRRGLQVVVDEHVVEPIEAARLDGQLVAERMRSPSPVDAIVALWAPGTTPSIERCGT